ncbi:MAG: oxidoreductase [Epibacterium sp.]|jgi:hypothetical protein|nr:oxidoreductase [Epibacterium sp.]NQX72200.1 oxidoreductase [Epibacterium sp.]
MMKKLLTLLGFVTALLMPGVAISEGTVLSVRAEGSVHDYTLAQLRALGEVKVQTTTIWTEGEQHFVGVPLRSLMAGLGIHSGTVTASAVNDYAVVIPLADASATAPIIAYERNGATMSLREKGPLWVIYPYDSDPAYRTEETYSRSIWQLNRLAAE